MVELQQIPPPPTPSASRDHPSPPLPASRDDPPPPPPTPPPRFDPSRMIGIIKRKALIKDLAGVYHAECLTYCQELLELQRKWEQAHVDVKTPEDTRKETIRPTKRVKKSR